MGKSTDLKPMVYLAAFGKHPGWDDHIDDLGVETDRLAQAKRQLYTDGIAGNVESGAWGRPGEPAPAGLIRFGHAFIWLLGQDTLLGRLWPSRDGKKPPRTNYPMVLCAQARAIAPEWGAAEVLPRLEALQQRLMGTESAGEVRATLDAEREQLRAAAGRAPLGLDWTVRPERLAMLASHADVGGADGRAGVGFQRIAYELQKEMGDLRAGGSGVARLRSGVFTARAAHLRVPACLPGDEALLAWLGWLRAEVGLGTPIMAIRPVGLDTPRPWVDLVVGDPTAATLYGVRASPEAAPFTSDVPYTLDGQFIARVDERVARWRSSGAGAASGNGDGGEREPPRGRLARLWRWAAGG